MARPVKRGLSYFPRSVNYFFDYKIMDLLSKYGPLGMTIFDIILTMVYAEGYYLAVPLDHLAAQIVRLIGNRWVNNKELVLQVIRYCGEIGLFHDDLLRQGVITSAEIQENYAEKLTLQEIADASAISTRECLRCFQNSIHQSPIEYLTEYRIQAAAKLLESTDLSVTEISIRTGWGSGSYFTKAFREIRGKTPNAYRKEYRALQKEVLVR